MGVCQGKAKQSKGRRGGEQDGRETSRTGRTIALGFGVGLIEGSGEGLIVGGKEGLAVVGSADG